MIYRKLYQSRRSHVQTHLPKSKPPLQGGPSPETSQRCSPTRALRG